MESTALVSTIIPKDFKKWCLQFLCLALSRKRNSVKDKPASSLVVCLGKTLTGCLYLYVADRWSTPASLG